MNITQKFNALNGVRVSRLELKNLVQEAKNQNNTEIIYRISKVLNAHPEAEYFELEIQQYPTQTGLGAARHLGNYKEALDNCGRLKKGWKFQNGSVVKVEKKEKKSSKNTKTSPKKEEKTEKSPTNKEAFLQKYKEIPLLEILLKNAQPMYQDSKKNSIGQPKSAEPNLIFWKRKPGKEVSDMIIKFKGITKHPLFTKENFAQYVLFRFNSKAEQIFDQWQKILDNSAEKTSPKKEVKNEKITKKTEKSPSDNRPLLEKSLDELYTQFAGRYNASRQQFYKDISEKFGVHKLVAYVFVNTLGIKNYWLVTKNDFPMAQKVFKDFNKFFSKKKSEGAFFKLEFTDFSKEILAWIEKRKNWKKYWIPTDENYLSAPDGLYGLEYIPYNEQNDELLGLGKAVSPEQIYKMITQKVIASMKKATGKGYVKKWKSKNLNGFFVPVNFSTKKPYRGINFLMLKTRLKEGVFGVFENPYFLTFNQIKEKNGKLKKGAKGYEVIYFSFHYKVFIKQNGKKKTLFKSFDFDQVMNFIKEKGLKKDENLEKFPILRYYNVYNGSDIEGIDFQLDKIEVGKLVPEDSPENKAANLMVKNYPNPPKIHHGGDRAFYYPVEDLVQIPPYNNFETANDYYRTLLHELTHSTGHEKRLNRDLSGRFGSKSYAQEELVAEFGAIFLSAHAGIMWQTNKNHTEYLKGWNKVFEISEKDNKFLMRGASMAQKAADHILNLDKDGQPKFYKELKKSSQQTKISVLKKKDNALAAPKIELSTDDFKKMSVSELREFTMNYYRENLKGKRISPEKFPIIIEFTARGEKKLYAPMYSAKASVIEHLEELIKNSTYNNWGNRKKTDSPDVLGYLNFKSKLTIDGEKRHIRISVIVDDKRKTRFKSFDLGKKKNDLTHKVHFGEPINDRVKSFSQGKNTKKTEKTNFGLGFLTETDTNTDVFVEKTSEEIENFTEKSSVPARRGSIAEQMSKQPQSVESFQIFRPDMQQFLGDLEKKNHDSLVITLTGGQGSGKTRFAFQFINDLGQTYKVGHISNEEHPQSRLYAEKVKQYLNPIAQGNTEAHDVSSVEELHEIIRRNEVVVIDSFQKIRELDPKFEVDKDLRKKYDGKLFLVIFQQTTDGKMRGGAKSQFDGDIILFTEKFENYQQNFVYPNKNRYNSTPLHLLKYGIFNQKLEASQEFQPAGNQVFNII